MSKPLKPYFVEYTITAVVMAEDETNAFNRARYYLRDAVNDAGEVEVWVRNEVKTAADLEDGWDEECVPYGGDGNTRLGEYLKQADEPGEPK